MKNIGIMGPEGKSPIDQDPNFNVAMSEEVTNALSEKCERVNQLEKYVKEVKQQAKTEVEDLKDMVRKFEDENLRLKELLRKNGVEY